MEHPPDLGGLIGPRDEPRYGNAVRRLPRYVVGPVVGDRAQSQPDSPGLNREKGRCLGGAGTACPQEFLLEPGRIRLGTFTPDAGLAARQPLAGG